MIIDASLIIDLFEVAIITSLISFVGSILGLCDNGRTYILIMHYNIISITIISR